MTEIEPWLEKTLFLLNSKAEDSTEQLRLMLEESIRNKYGHKKMFLRPIPSPSSVSQKKDEAALLNANKKRKTDSKSKFTASPKGSTSSSESSGSNESDFTLEVDELSCVVCRGISFIPHNRLVECADCHSLYHQECHNPPIEDLDVNDPRGVWYCVNCSKSLTNSKVGSTSSSSVPYSKSSYQKTSNFSQRSGHSSFSNKPFGGLSVPAKKSSGSSSSNSSKSSSNSSKSVSPNMNIINADKRLQIMKKKAAKKQEKRIISK